ncbi:hypothetical protein ACIQF6_14710 [Kitasatospora sp. NPDC092948]|uniref:hypothetical protein n=1 Tax=Kitasatospora sp. NPDC092948 TaxID=3364088 RepID=UPI00380A06BD
MPRFLVDLAERTSATYAEALIGLLLVGGITSLSAAESAAVAAIPAGLAVVKGALSSFLGRTGTAALLPTAADPASRE